ncbi:uncharacterized protein LOC121753047 isoform X1 [Salvia splendens]|uniref:uncharacterized protein LOC121753047 isoform X1 n=1 Tax=Salvia splendens TaxID=180675 RepID=UPI001C25952C|nr:uncharacterized protein LOC121753047 isoform X1 [Salvia splendens]
MAMTDPSPTLTPAKRVECEVVTHPDEPPKRLHQSLSEDVGSDSDIDALFESGVTRVVEVEEEESDGEVPDDLKNSEDYKKYLQLITESDGNDCGSFDFPYFDYIIAPATQTHIDRNSVYVSPALDDYNKLHNRKLVFDSIEKMNLQFAPCCYNKYFVTFKVKDMDDGAALKTFQCSFMTFINGPTIEQFREKPTQP